MLTFKTQLIHRNGKPGHWVVCTGLMALASVRLGLVSNTVLGTAINNDIKNNVSEVDSCVHCCLLISEDIGYWLY